MCVCASVCVWLPSNKMQISSQQRGGVVSRVEQWIWMAMEYRTVIPPDVGGTQCKVESPPCQGV